MTITKRRNNSCNQHISILLFYEKNCGGESIATENIYQQLKQTKNLKVKAFKLTKLKKTNSVSFFRWHIKNILYAAKQIYQHRQFNFIYTTTYTAGVAASILKSIYNKFNYKICFHYHGNRLPDKPNKNLKTLQQLTQFIKYHLSYQLHKVFLLSTDLIFVPSHFSKQHFMQHFPFIKNKRIIIVANGVDTSKFKSVSKTQQKKLRKKYQLFKDSTKSNKKIISYVGSINPRKNLLLLIETFAKLIKNNDNYLLLIIHPKVESAEEIAYLKKIKQQVAQLKINHQVKWFISPHKIEHFYQISDLVILLSHLEHMALVVLEALACKTLLMSSTSGFSKKILLAIDSKLVINSQKPISIANQIEQICNQSFQDLKLVKNKSRQITAKYSWGKTAKLIAKELSNQQVQNQ